MLKLNYSINSASAMQEIDMDDFYVSPDMTFISGTTEHINCCSPGSTLWVKSPYFPEDLPAQITSVNIVRRNGYIRTPLKLQIQTGKVIYEESGSTVTQDIKFVEYNGNTYYCPGSYFKIDNVTYEPDTISGFETGFLTIGERHYIENGKVNVDGITFDVHIGKLSGATFTDSVGQAYIQPDTWDLTHVTSASTIVEKIVAGENVKREIKTRSIKSYGHKAYITYNGTKYYVKYFNGYDAASGAGVTINNVPYQCDALISDIDVTNPPSYNIYNIRDYSVNEYGLSWMTISGNTYPINFESCEINGSGIICIETVDENLPILKDDIITIKSLDSTSEVRVKYDENYQNGYVLLNGRRYDVIENLCNTVTIDGVEYDITYEYLKGINRANTLVTAVGMDGEIMYFDTIRNDPSQIRKIYPFSTHKEMPKMVESSGTTIYSAITQTYDVNQYDGILVNGTKMRIYEKTVTGYKPVNSHDDVPTDSYKYVIVGSLLDYDVKVESTVGSNKFLCIPYVPTGSYSRYELNEISNEILATVTQYNFTVLKRDNTFGVKGLYYDTWALEAYKYGYATSVYDLANVKENIRPFRKRMHFTVPINLYKNVSNKSEYEDLVMNQLYDEEAEKAVNPIVDMEKDMYSPVIKLESGDLISPEKIVFNMHFRTRDLDTWKIIEDEGTYETTVMNPQTTNLSANYQYCNYFMTDYYPYFKYSHTSGSTYSSDNYIKEKFLNVLDKSDLLGFLYFTTDDVKYKKDKLAKSFLRLTFFDSKNPEKQNMLGTSTLYFDCERYANILQMGRYQNEHKQSQTHIHYEEVAKSRQYDRKKIFFTPKDEIDWTTNNSISVLTEPFKYTPNMSQDALATDQLWLSLDGYDATDFRLDSSIIVKNRLQSNGRSSEGYDNYILKAFANKREEQTIYMKMEFFHAGLGIKIPMLVPNKWSSIFQDYSAIGRTAWTKENYKDLIGGYDLDTVTERLYVPLKVWYDRGLRRFVYRVDSKFSNAIIRDNILEFNIFELKIKP